MLYVPGASNLENNSGKGPSFPVPEEIKGWNWGAFLLNWIWAIGNNTYIGLLALVPYLGFIMVIILGIKGNEWAWLNRRWDSIEHFKSTQRVWTNVGLVLLIIEVFIIVAIVVIGGLVAISES